MWVIRGSFLLGMIFLQGEGVVDAPKEITHEWEKRVLGVSYEVADLVHAVEELAFGVAEPEFGKEFFERIAQAIKNKETGEYIEYWTNGKLKAKLPYKKGKPNGHIHGWYRDGNDAFKGFFKEGVKQGSHIMFFPAGPFGRVDDARILNYNEIGQLNWRQTINHPKSTLATCVYYKEGRVDGSLECWDVTGTQTIAAVYKANILQKESPPQLESSKNCYSPAENYLNEITTFFIKEAKNRLGVRAISVGGPIWSDVESIKIDFVAHGTYTLDEARKLIVNLKEGLSEVANQCEKLKPYLRNCPFTSDMADVSFIVVNQKGCFCDDGSIASVSILKKNMVHYSNYDPKTKKLVDLYEEPYEDAVKIVKGILEKGK